MRHVWLTCGDTRTSPFVTAYRCRFSLDHAATIRIHVSADERYQLFLDGRLIGRGPDRGDPAHWFFQTYDLDLAGGDHVLVARVWSLGDYAPLAQMSAAPGFTLWAEPPFDTLLDTGLTPWDAMRLEGYEFRARGSERWPAYFVGPNTTVDAARFPWGFERGNGESWQPALAREEIMEDPYGSPAPHTLSPTLLPPQLDEPRRAGHVRFVVAAETGDTRSIPLRAADDRADEMAPWQALVGSDVPLSFPPDARRRVLLDLGDYVCAYPHLITSGGRGSTIRLSWAEALFLDPGPNAGRKGDRDEIEDRYFEGLMSDTFHPDGGPQRHFDSLWWRAGCYIELLVETGDEALTIERLELHETRYPLELESRFEAGDARIGQLIPIMLRSVQMCAHETYMDCPYYEQLMYVGDTRLQALITYAICRDDRLPRQALALLNASRLPRGLTQSRYPSRLTQIIPPFALWWIAMVYDYALWRGDRPFVAGLLPGARTVVDAYLQALGEDGLARSLPGWNFVDWVPSWENGTPPHGVDGVSAMINWQLVGVLDMVAELEAWAGEEELARRAGRHAGAMAAQLLRLFWDDGRGLFADDRAGQQFSEHTQCLALLSGRLDAARQERLGQALLTAPDLTRTSFYFTHYLFEAYRLLGRIDALLERLGPWFQLLAQGFKTTPETPEPTRSDCHAWGAHPLYHLFASVLGIRPGSFGFRTVEIAPQLGPLWRFQACLVHPDGFIDVDIHAAEGRLEGTISLPPGISGFLRHDGRTQQLSPGAQEIHLS